MKVKPISRSIKATALCNPNPSFVSQVKAGANQKPWRAVKMDAAVPVDDKPEDSMKIKPTQKAASAVVAAVAPKGYGVMQFEFAKSEFADEAAVNAWMEAGGYSDYTVTETAKGFEIADDAGRFIAGSVSKIDGFHKGVTAFVGKLTNPDLTDADEPEEGDATETAKAAADAIAAAASPVVDPPARTRAADPAAEPAAEPAEPEAAPAADPAPAAPAEPEAPAQSEAEAPAQEAPVSEEPAQPVAPEGAGAPPAQADEPQSDAQRAQETIQRADQMLRERGVYEASRLGEIVNSLGWIVYDAEYAGLSDETVTQIKTAANALLTAFMAAAQDAADELTEVFRSVEERAARSQEPAAPAAPAIETPVDVAALVRSAVTEAVAPLTERLTAAETATTEARERADNAERELRERVEADNARGQTRKGADDPIATESTTTKAADRSVASTTILRSFGSRHA